VQVLWVVYNSRIFEKKIDYTERLMKKLKQIAVITHCSFFIKTLKNIQKKLLCVNRYNRISNY